MKLSQAQQGLLQHLAQGGTVQCDQASVKVYAKKYIGDPGHIVNLNTISNLLKLGLIEIDEENTDALFMQYALTEQGQQISAGLAPAA